MTLKLESQQVQGKSQKSGLVCMEGIMLIYSFSSALGEDKTFFFFRTGRFYRYFSCIALLAPLLSLLVGKHQFSGRDSHGEGEAGRSTRHFSHSFRSGRLAADWETALLVQGPLCSLIREPRQHSGTEIPRSLQHLPCMNMAPVPGLSPLQDNP